MGRPGVGKPAPYPRLLADVGGTRVRLAWLDRAGARPVRAAAYLSAEHAGIDAVIDRYLDEQRLPTPRAAALAVAASVAGDRVEMSNLPWAFSVRALTRRWRLDRLLVLNDFAALARGLPAAPRGELTRVGGGSAVAGAPLAVLGPGTGLGVAGLLPGPTGPLPVVGEGGHVSLSAGNAEEERVIAQLRARFGHVSAERALSGAGLVNLHRACCELDGRDAGELDPAAISDRARAGSDPDCVRALALFFAFLGSVAGDLALTLGARGGVFIAGGIVPRLGDAIAGSAFRDRFEAKGRFRSYLQRIPTRVVADASRLALRGADLALDGAPSSAVAARHR